MKEWAYLWSEPFRLRNVLAAYFLRDCREIIDIGGYKSPISDFVDSGVKVTVIDPRAEQRREGNIEHLPIRFQDWEGIPGPEYGLVILGMELCMGATDWDRVYRLVDGSKTTVIGIAAGHMPSVNQMLALQEHVSKPVKMSMQLDLTGNDFGNLTDSAPPYCLRRLTVFE